MLITRAVAQDNQPIELQISMSVYALLTVIILALFNQQIGLETQDWRMLNLTEFLVMLLLGAVATTGHLMVVFALQRADAGLLAPFQYLEVVTASFLGYLIFQDVPQDTTIAGVTIIICAGLYLIHRERQSSKNTNR